jgi:hypothetical protein
MALPHSFIVEADRVLVSSKGDFDGVPLLVASEQYRIWPDIIFLRKDGWKLGAKVGDSADEAFRMWREDWEGFFIVDKDGRPKGRFHNISEYGKS